MARTASMTVADCEALLGPRGRLTVHTGGALANRDTVRKWLVAQGVSSGFACGLAAAALQASYNDTTDKVLTRQRAQSDAARALEPIYTPVPSDVVVATPIVDDATISVATNGAAPIAPAGAPDGAGSKLAALIEEIAGGARSAVTEAECKALIDRRYKDLLATLPALVKDHCPVTRLEIVTPTETRNLGTAPRHHLLPDMITALSCGIPVALIGPAGAGKTTACEQAAAALALPFYMNGAISGAHEYLGYMDAHGVYHSTPFRQAFEHGGLYCADEIDAGDPCGILIINSALANGLMPFPDSVTPIQKHADFRMVACANTFMLGADRHYVGRNQLDAATIDRFAVLDWSYDEALERALCPNAQWTARVQKLRAAAIKEKATIIISPRASIYGARLLAAGMTQTRVEELVVWKGLDADVRGRVEGRVS